MKDDGTRGQKARSISRPFVPALFSAKENADKRHLDAPARYVLYTSISFNREIWRSRRCFLPASNEPALTVANRLFLREPGNRSSVIFHRTQVRFITFHFLRLISETGELHSKHNKWITKNAVKNTRLHHIYTDTWKNTTYINKNDIIKFLRNAKRQHVLNGKIQQKLNIEKTFICSDIFALRKIRWDYKVGFFFHFNESVSVSRLETKSDPSQT